ncbi:MAG TPA: Rieske 2Fe-2S domain-containing protein, partial [Desulfosarcina sp.]|nr:Rieske 2Fe-2S domain-containing protein [Desulfosarcina sp.]
GLGGAALMELFWVVGAFLRPGRGAGGKVDAGQFIEAGAVTAFARGTVTAFPRGRFYLARLDDGGFLALSRRCQHLGCSLPWVADEGRFVCPCHSSAFDIRGDVLHAPAPRAMALHPIVIENGVVRVDAATIIDRSRFQADQVVHPKKV